ncbi:MAG: histidinol dehydrogenase [Candidatus Omnitrophica bacterium]|nr:histidinol dehydrogenase [Candidatus Omnitrophota bacterium]MDE2008832.1 histidinol dehydrogenase [Candidatus Omnitrophota bacterium]MDE2213605.1 histidinol dehydrogenase [Candidatus Omnitrophota bacterium]MDE2230494.1 histidinol dehydrogenase [Candidatus Omnitrophota bacterium]
MKLIKQTGQNIEKLYDRSRIARKKYIEEKVRVIIDDVRSNGDDALVKYTRRFDGVRLTPRQFCVAESEISGAFQDITPEFIGHLKTIINNVSLYYKKQLHKPCKVKGYDGIMLKEEARPLDSVGIYIPAGTAPLLSSVYMTAIPAIIAGVGRIVIVTPPDREGNVNPYILAVANLLKVVEIYKVGGAQAIAALALGTRTIPRVDKIVGPGNWYVTEAKRQLFGYVDIDMLAGPTELVVIANRYTDPDFVVGDLEAQMEHIGGVSILLSTSRQLIKDVRKRVSHGFCVLCKNINEAVEIANRLAPEHLQIMTSDAVSIAKKIRHAGAIFLGPYSPTALGDYAAGPSHVLPTMGTARFFSGLSLSSFTKTSHVISYSKKALERVREPLEKVANLEGMVKHAESVNVRFK